MNQSGEKNRCSDRGIFTDKKDEFDLLLEATVKWNRLNRAFVE